MFQIMVVEDDINARRLMQAVIEQNGYAAIPASDGAEALALMDKKHVDLIVLDVMMPHMDGYTLARELRSAGNNVPILMVTARQSAKDKKEGFLAGTDDYMVKPVDEEEMMLRIAALLRRSRIVSERRLTIGSTTLDSHRQSGQGAGGIKCSVHGNQVAAVACCGGLHNSHAVCGLNCAGHIGGGNSNILQIICRGAFRQNGQIGRQGLSLGVGFNDGCGCVVQHSQQRAADQADHNQNNDRKNQCLKVGFLFRSLCIVFSHYSFPPFAAFWGFL